MLASGHYAGMWMRAAIVVVLVAGLAAPLLVGR